MFCPKCGTKNPADGRFCRGCGADLGNVSEALSGKLQKPQNLIDKKGKPVSYESAIVKIFTGLAFFIVAIVLGLTNVAGGKFWWFWMLIPAFSTLGGGVAQYVNLRKIEQQRQLSNAYSTETPNLFSSAPQNSSLPPIQSDYIAPDSRYKTGELVPPSVTESTTRHLKMDSEGETMALPKK